MDCLFFCSGQLHRVVNHKVMRSAVKVALPNEKLVTTRTMTEVLNWPWVPQKNKHTKY